MSGEFVRDAMLPGESRSEKPKAAERQADFKPEAGIYSRKQKKQQDDERRRLSEDFAGRHLRRPERPGDDPP